MVLVKPKEWLRAMYSHVFLPPRLPPGEDDECFWELSCVRFIMSSLERFGTFVDNEHQPLIEKALNALKSLHNSVDEHGVILEDKLKGLLTSSEYICLHIKAQNAGLIIRSDAEQIIAEAFELSPKNENVYGTTGRLQRYFPSEAVALPKEQFFQPEFISELATMLAKLSHQSFKEMKSQTKKGGNQQVEVRNTTDPRLIRELVMSILHGIGGKRIDVPGVWKNTREEVIYGQKNTLPWRRSPVWLLCRVTLELVMSRQEPVPPNDGLYKRFMVFLMASFLQEMLRIDPDPEVLYIMNAKIARRLIKLDIDQEEPWMVSIKETIMDAKKAIEASWTNIIRNDKRKLAITEIKTIEMTEASKMECPRLDSLIKRLSMGASSSSDEFTPPDPSIFQLDEHELPKVDAIAQSGSYEIYNLASFEAWVAQHLYSWCALDRPKITTCIALRDLIESYHRVASATYSGQPEGSSIMFLTLLDLWIACDKLAVSETPLIAQYRPEIPIPVWRALLLKSQGDMERLWRAENYLQKRESDSRYQGSIITGFGDGNCFPARYASSSNSHQELKHQILEKAAQDREAKKAELLRLQNRYHELMRQHDALQDCDYVDSTDSYGDPTQEHAWHCRKCSLRKAAENLSIQPHEWPLPRNNEMAQSVVFELEVPPVFGAWRDCTTYFLSNILKFGQSTCKLNYRLELSSFHGLSSYFTSYCFNIRVSILSTAKPQNNSHYKHKSIDVTEESDVCLETGPVWHRYDRNTGSFMGAWAPSLYISEQCTFTIPNHARILQDFLSKPWTCPDGRAPNEVIARQSECPLQFGLEEFQAYCTMGHGCNIQWSNILVQLAMPSLDWNKDETLLLVWQLAEQAGTLSETWRRKCHDPLIDSTFVKACLTHLRDSLAKVRKSWESCPTVATFTILATRLLVLCSEDVQNDCLEFLEECRTVCYEWCEILRLKVSKSQDVAKADFSQKAHQAASICLISLDVPDHNLPALLSDDNNAKILLAALITLQETESMIEGSATTQRQLTFRCHRLLRRCHQILVQKIIVEESLSLDEAICSTWATFKRASNDTWRVVNQAWLGTSMKLNEGSCVTVHFNLITGALLVNGLPLSRLPFEYESHDVYHRLLGNRTIEATPSIEPGMQLSSVSKIHGYELHFALSSIPSAQIPCNTPQMNTNWQHNTQSDLFIRAKKGSQTWELLPTYIFDSLLPRRLISKFFHWYNLERSVIEFRPLQKRWEEQSFIWEMRKTGSFWELKHHEGHYLVFPSTSGAMQFEKTFNPLEERFGLHISVDRASGCVEVQIPRLQLEFTMDTETRMIRSRQYKDMCVDDDQSITTLIGLESKLVLRNYEDENASRVVLIPDNPPQVRKALPHVSVSIGKSTTKHYAYILDSVLGRLEGPGTLKSRLFLAELHAITSGIIADPFTRQTGTAAALSILTSAAVSSFSFFSEEEVEVLSRIGNLSPVRVYYPAHLQVMQNVTWNENVSCLSQHEDFRAVVQQLWRKVNGMSFLHEQDLPELHVSTSIDILNRRAACRSAMFYNYGFSEEDSISKHDKIYTRDTEENHFRSTRVIKICTLLSTTEETLLDNLDSSLTAKTLYKLLSGESGSSKMPALQYDAKWLRDTSTIAKKYWCRIHSTLGASNHGYSKSRLMIWLATMAYSKDADMSLIQAFVGFVSLPIMQQIQPPKCNLAALGKGYRYCKSTIDAIINSSQVEFKESTEFWLPKHTYESNQQSLRRREAKFKQEFKNKAQQLESQIMKQWMCRKPTIPVYESGYIKFHKAMQRIQEAFAIWHDNWNFNEYLVSVCDALRNADKKSLNISIQLLEPLPYEISRRSGFVSMRELLERTLPPAESETSSAQDFTSLLVPSEVWCGQRCQTLASSLRKQASSRQENRYLDMLQDSIGSLSERVRQYRLSYREAGMREVLKQAGCRSHQSYENRFTTLYETLERKFGNNSRSGLSSSSLRMAALTHQWPVISPQSLLSRLSNKFWKQLTKPWRYTLVSFAISLTDVQALDRLQHAKSDLVRELQNVKPRTWDPMEFPDSLLLEIEGNLRIRRVQEEISAKMRQPPDNQNAVMQLNMGEGKSSVIVPNIAASLADGSRLVRVVVAKPQSKQMQDMLVSKLGGLIGRRVYHMPFSRSVRISKHQAEKLDRHCRECLQEGGVLLVQPEHILSFQLNVIETCIRSEIEVGQILLNMQQFFIGSARDIVDESDENFSTKFELIYTMGGQHLVELGSDRWTIIQEIMSLVTKYASIVKRTMPRSIELDEETEHSFPHTRFLDQKASDKVLSEIADHLCRNGLRGFPISRQSPKIRAALRSYILELQPDRDVIELVEGSDFWEVASQHLLLIRGLIAKGVLAFVFGEKRWRVNYGLDFTRKPETRLAIPYRAKDNPSPRSEFSHPDVVICLSCLSYYYNGLNIESLRIAFSHLLKSDQIDIEYQEWVKTSNKLPIAFKDIKGINFRDEEQFANEVFPCLRSSKGAIDYYLSHIVFPREMKEFPKKISASGWDIGCVKTHPLTGFSGTNDSQHVLPLDVKQLDLASQKHTNAMVLENLMGSENSVISLADHGVQGRCRTHELLQAILKLSPEVRVILDVGAQIIELTNEQLAQSWLDLSKGHEKTQAVIYCNEDDEVCVLDRRGHKELLNASPFAKQLDVCLVFLDEAHTRGIDLRLPQNYRAAVTLGANLTKDRLVQACMRMRKLGAGQSVVFCVPEEIEIKIRASSKVSEMEKLSVSDVLAWSIHETWKELRRSIPVWSTQGTNFARQSKIWERVMNSDDPSMDQDTAREFLEDEAQSLETRYKPSDNQLNCSQVSTGDYIIDGIAERCRLFDEVDLSAGALQEEQERELAPEIEEERQLERAPPAEPAKHELHPDVVTFVRNGTIGTESTHWGFKRAFQSLVKTTAAQEFDVSEFPRGLLVTQDFARTIKDRKSEAVCMDTFQRTVQWVLTDGRSGIEVQNMVLISPYEANLLMPEIKTSKFVMLHLFSPRKNSLYQPLDDLRLYPFPSNVPVSIIPRRLIIELDIFSGQLYFDSYQEYAEVCEFLCLAHTAAEDGIIVRPDGFIDPGCHETDRCPSTVFRRSPVKFLKCLMGNIRRHGSGIDKTHMGKVLDGALLTEDDFVGETADQ